MEIDKKAVGRRIEFIRKEKGMTLEEFGKLFNATKGNVSLWQKGSSLPSNERLVQIAKISGRTVEQILYGFDYESRIQQIIRNSPSINNDNYKTYYEELTVRYFEKINYLYPTEEEVIKKYLDIVETRKTELTLNSMVDSLGNNIDAIDQHYQGFININMDDINKLNTEHLQELSDNINEAVEKQRELKTLLYNLDNND
ncbi:helix-turn-helix domain-containing protein [Aerococcus urinaeequi]|uniref:helix-turn-helix domain-containing protein n=1 Tax=Aerococcus urinaeequi TaxID=51665 RepID=UPI003D6B29B2